LKNKRKGRSAVNPFFILQLVEKQEKVREVLVNSFFILFFPVKFVSSLFKKITQKKNEKVFEKERKSFSPQGY